MYDVHILPRITAVCYIQMYEYRIYVCICTYAYFNCMNIPHIILYNIYIQVHIICLYAFKCVPYVCVMVSRVCLRCTCCLIETGVSASGRYIHVVTTMKM